MFMVSPAPCRSALMGSSITALSSMLLQGCSSCCLLCLQGDVSQPLFKMLKGG